jgi:hypothetical protein
VTDTGAVLPQDRRRDRGGLLDWMFRDRTTGAITVAQVPNVPLLVWLVATVLQRFWDPVVAGREALAAVSTAALVIWAGDEVLRGVNPFRRLLGAGVLVWLLWSHRP